MSEFGAIEIVSGGAAVGLTISSGGIAVVSSGGSAGARELEGGYELVASGGILSGATISAGTLEVASGGAIANSEVAFAGAGTLQRDERTGFGWHVAGFGTGDQIGFTGRDDEPPSQQRRNRRSDLHRGRRQHEQHADRHRRRQHRRHHLLGQYTATSFATASDGNGGTLTLHYDPRSRRHRATFTARAV